MTTLPSDPWDHWEDYQNGLYRRQRIDLEQVVLSVELLTDSSQFLEVAHEMMREWPIATHHNIVECGTHRRSWTGQASCCYAHGATAGETIQAWNQLSRLDQDRANNVADAVITVYLRGGRGHGQTLFDD